MGADLGAGTSASTVASAGIGADTGVVRASSRRARTSAVCQLVGACEHESRECDKCC
jgi:hypothetical protein